MSEKFGSMFAKVCAAVAVFASLLTLPSPGVCGTPAASVPERLSVTYVISPLNIPTIVEKREDMFQKAFPGTDIVLPELNAGPKQTAAMAAGEVDIAHCLGATSAILAASEGLDIKIIGIYSRAPKAFMIMADDPGIATLSDLKGKKIGGPKGTILHQLLVSAASSAGMSDSDYEFINMGIPAAAAALSSGSIDAALLAGADAYRAANAGARTLADGVGHVDATTVIATTKKYLDKNGEVVDRFMDMHRSAIRFIGENEGEAISMTAEETKLSRDAVEAMYPWYDFSPDITPADVEELERTQEFMLKNGLQRKSIDIGDIIAFYMPK